MAVRDDLSAAVDSITGLACTPKYRQTSEAGHAFVKLDRVEYPNRFGGVCFWQVFVMLPADRADAEQFVEDTAQDLYDALDGGVRKHLVVTAVRTQDTQFEPGGPVLPTLVIEGTREQE